MFQSDSKDILRRLNAKEFTSTEERDQLLQRLERVEGLRARDVIWMLFRPDRGLRDAGVRILQRLKDPETVDLFLGEAKTKGEAAVRGAAALLFSLGVPGVENRLIALISGGEKDIQELARKLVLEAPPSKALDAVLWQIAQAGKTEERTAAIARLAASASDPASIPRWEKLARDSSAAVRDKVLEMLATNAPEATADLLVEMLPMAGYSTQQHIVGALTRVAETKGAAFASRLLPLIASGDAGTRSAVLKILVGLDDRRGVIREYIRFSKTLAGWARDRALESMRAFGDDLIEPVMELLNDPDHEIRSTAMVVAGSFEDPRIVPATIGMLRDEDWWIRISAVETLGRIGDKRAVDPLIATLEDPDARWAAVEALGRIGDTRALPALGKMLSDPQPDVRIEILQALIHFDHPQVAAVIQKVAATDPSRAVRSRALDLAQELASRNKGAIADEAALRNAAMIARSSEGEPKLHTFLVGTRNQGASDFHIAPGQPPIIRMAGELMRAQAAPFTSEQTEPLIREILTEDQWAKLQQYKQLDFCYFIPNAGRYRANVFLDHKGYSAVFRVIPEKPPTIAELGLPPNLAEIADYHQGLVLVCGPSGSGKSTTLAALVNLFNETKHHHVITMEDPVEFVHPFKNCLINQREVGSHTRSFARALRAALREDPDVIVIGEMRDPETISLALTAAETGHIVLGTLNSTSAPKAVDRVIASFSIDEQAQIRVALSEALKFVVAQRLLPAKEQRKLVACFEVLRITQPVSNLIRDEKTYQIYSAMQIGRSVGMQTVDDALKELVKRNAISPETAWMAATKREDFEPMVSADFLKQQSFV